MSDKFDPYYTWLGIPPEEQPPDHYRLLGVRRFENNPEVISNVLVQRLAHIRSFQTGERADAAKRLLDELAQAGDCLTNADKKGAYDRDLRQKDAPKLGRPAAVPQFARPAAPQFAKPAAPQKPSASAPTSGKPPMPGPIDFHEIPPRLPSDSNSWQLPALLAAGGVGLLFLGVGVVLAGMFGAGFFSTKPTKGPPIAAAPLPAKQQFPDSPKGIGEANPPGGGFVFPSSPMKSPSGGSPTKPNPSGDLTPPASTPGDGTPPKKPVAESPPPKPEVEPAPVEPPPVEPAPSLPAEPKVETTVTPSTPGDIPKETRVAVPSDADRDRGITQLREIYKPVTKPSDKAALALKLANDAAGESDPQILYAYLWESRRLKLEAGEMDGAFDVAEEMIARFALDPWKTRIELLKQAPKWADASTEKKALAEISRRLTEEAFAAAEFTAAREAAEVAEKLGDSKLRKQAEEWKAVAESALVQESAQADAIAKLKTLPDDPEANQARGRFLCLMKRDWAAGLPHLAKARAATLSEAARQDLAGPATAGEQVGVGDAWWKIAETLPTGREKDSLQLRARWWYEQGLLGVSGLSAATTAKRIEETEEIAGRAVAPADSTIEVLPDPINLYKYYREEGKVFYFDVVGNVSGSVYGSGQYTTDSTLATAAVHAGVLKNGKAGVVKVTILKGRTSYAGTTRNGVTTSSWGNYDSSYKVEAGPKFGIRRPTDASKTFGSKDSKAKRPGDSRRPPPRKSTLGI